MLTDEKIARLKKQYRNNLKKQEERDKRFISSETAQQLCEKLDNGYLVLPDMFLKTGTKNYFDGLLSVPHLNQFYDREDLGTERVMLINRQYKLKMVIQKKRKKARISIEDWCHQIAEEYYKLTSVMEYIKAETMPDRDYICYKANSAGVRMFQICFMIYGNEYQMEGKCECSEEKSNTLGLLLEAMVLKMKADADKEDMDGDRNYL